ncbi:MAG: class I SAM-dependent methyltransferase [Nannocystaceae bacterium]|nr:methyltransferase [bacterium]
MQRMRISFALLALSLSACTKQAPDTATPATPATPEQPGTEATVDAEAPSDVWAVALEGSHRSDENKARDQFRHPKETLQFFGVTPSSNVVELAPGGGWYTEILAPLLHEQGKLTLSVSSPEGPQSYYGTRQTQAFIEKKSAQPDVYGNIELAITDSTIETGEDGKVKSIKVNAMDLGPAGSADVVLTFRSSHGWYRREALDLAYKAAFDVLKPGGVFGVVQHRAAEGADPSQSAKAGYMPEATIIAAAKAAGFELGESSEINANPKDTKDYEGGVWTLPPSLSKGETDRDKYLAIGESDRMTLKFVKPGA